MKKNHLFTLIIFATLSGFRALSQDIKIDLKSANVKINESFNISFSSELIIDSTDNFSFEGFKILSGPMRSTSMSINNDKTTSLYEISYTLQPVKPGVFTILCPKFYSKGKIMTGTKTAILVSGEALTPEEIHAMKVDQLKASYNSINGAKRFVISNDIGIIEEYNDYNWKFLRELTTEEIKVLEGILK